MGRSQQEKGDAAMLQNKKEQAYEIIKRKILSEEYPLGFRLNIGQLSTELGVSNSPIREALNLLEKEGLVVNSVNSGPRVVDMSEQDWFELAQTRFFWTISAYRFCATLGYDEAMCEDMEQVLAQQKRAYEEKDMFQFTHLANLFDRCIIVATRNKWLLKQYDAMFSLAFLGTLYALKREDPEIDIRQHENILSLMRQKRVRDAVDALAEHYYKPMWTPEGMVPG